MRAAAVVVALGGLLCAGAAQPGAPAAVEVRDGDLFVGGRPLTSGPAEDAAPDWSPDGRRVAFSRRSARGPAAAIVTISRDGGGARRLTPGVTVDTQPAWSPDGSRIAYASSGVGAVAFDIRVVGSGGGTSRLLVGGPADELAPSWSADGRRLRFVRLYADGRAERWEAAATGRDARLLGPAAEDEWLEREADSGTPAAGPRELLPDLEQRPPSGLELHGTRLGFDSATDNVGTGPLWLLASRAGLGDPMIVRQLVRLTDGGVREYPGVGRLHFTVARPHRHWHLRRFQQFELRRASDQRVVVRDRKVGFCLRDRYGVTARRVAAVAAPVFVGNCQQGRPNALTVDQGTSPGYTDRYGAHFHGQNLELRGLPAGEYVLVHRANVDGRLEELDYTNNTASSRLRLEWRGARPLVTMLRRCPGSDRC